MNALAFVLDGLYYGVSDFEYAAYSMVCVCATNFFFFFLVVLVSPSLLTLHMTNRY